MSSGFLASEPFRPARGLKSPHAQTIYAALFRPRRVPPVVRERWETSDGDFVDIDLLTGERGTPCVLVLHGLEASARASYVAEILRGCKQRGWSAAALNFRSCSGELNRLPRFYHSGETEDVLLAIQRVRQQVSGPLFAVGFSLGGNVLLVLLANLGERAPLDAAVAISVPYDLQACARTLDSGRGVYAAYRFWFLRSLRHKALAKLSLHPGFVDAVRIRRARGIEQFDDAVTAPLHGFANAAEYYARCSSGPLLGQIRRPPLLVTAADDPLARVPVPECAGANPALTVLITEQGGHVGFVAGSPWKPRYWAEQQALSFLENIQRTDAASVERNPEP